MIRKYRRYVSLLLLLVLSLCAGSAAAQSPQPPLEAEISLPSDEDPYRGFVFSVSYHEGLSTRIMHHYYGGSINEYDRILLQFVDIPWEKYYGFNVVLPVFPTLEFGWAYSHNLIFSGVTQVNWFLELQTEKKSFFTVDMVGMVDYVFDSGWALAGGLGIRTSLLDRHLQSDDIPILERTHVYLGPLAVVEAGYHFRWPIEEEQWGYDWGIRFGLHATYQISSFNEPSYGYRIGGTFHSMKLNFTQLYPYIKVILRVF